MHRTAKSVFQGLVQYFCICFPSLISLMTMSKSPTSIFKKIKFVIHVYNLIVSIFSCSSNYVDEITVNNIASKTALSMTANSYRSSILKYIFLIVTILRNKVHNFFLFYKSFYFEARGMVKIINRICHCM